MPRKANGSVGLRGILRHGGGVDVGKTCVGAGIEAGHDRCDRDNASFHKSPLIREAIESVGCELLFMSAYSPDLNPIEKFWAQLKAWLRSMYCPLLSLSILVDIYFREYKKIAI
jgi:hypothetical protein